MVNKESNIFLFSIDLEDVRLRVEDGLSYLPRVETLIDQYLEFLGQYNSKATFFTVGDIPKHYPRLIKSIVSQGHEIACHSNKHIAVTKQSKEEFREDLLRNMDNLCKAGAQNIIGYRAPTYSITPETPWAFEVLHDLGFQYSSSVLPAKNPLYGWEGFGQEPRKVYGDFWEIPVSLRKGIFLKVPFAGGVYFRFLPFVLIKKAFSFHFYKGNAITSYFHPYDIDTDQEKFMHPEINNNYIYNQLLYYNRKSVFSRLHRIMEEFNPSILPYKDYISLLNNDEYGKT